MPSFQKDKWGKVGSFLFSSDLGASLEEQPTCVQQTVPVRAKAASSCCAHIWFGRRSQKKKTLKIWNEIIRKQISYVQNTLFSF